MLDKLLDNKHILKAMNKMPDDANQDLVKARRKDLFSPLWENTGLTRSEVIRLVKERETDMVEEYSDKNVPEFLIRLEAQDVLIKMMHQRFKEEGIIEGEVEAQ